MRDKFMEFAREFGLIVIGYSGCDKSVMDLLDVLVRSPQFFKHGIYWCIRKGVVPCNRLRQLLRNDRVFWIEIDGFDEVLAALCNHLDISLPTAIVSPHEVAINRVINLVSSELEPNHPKIRTDKALVMEGLQRLRLSIEQAGLSNPKSGTPSESIGRLKSDSLPLLAGMLEVNRGNYGIAIEQFKECLKAQDINIHFQAWDGLINCYLVESDKHSEALKLIQLEETIFSGSSKYYLIKSYYALYLNESQFALEQAEKALKINPILEQALVNKGIALLQLASENDLQNTIEQLTNPSIDEQFRAAGYALAGDFNQMITFLQKAIVLKKYPAERAFIDVVFRPYWDYPQFQKKLMPFLTTKDPKIPYLKSCPPSAPEIELRKKVEV
jgi:tetratricopeptide (TPR) repeat protein